MQEDVKPQVPVKEHTFGPGPKNRKERRKIVKGSNRKGRYLGGAKVKR